MTHWNILPRRQAEHAPGLRLPAWSWLCLCLAPAWATAVAPPPFSARYTITTYGGLQVVELRMHFAPDPAHPETQYLLQVHMATVGWARLLRNVTLRMESRVRPAAGILQPVRYHYRREGYKQGELRMEFDRNQGRVELHAPGTPPQSRPLAPADLSDYLVYWMRLMTDLRGPETVFRYSVLTHGNKLKRYVFRREAEEILDTALGKVHTARLLRNEPARDDGEEVKLRVWCAPALDFLPVRVDFLRNGELHLRAQISEHDYAAPPAP